MSETEHRGSAPEWERGFTARVQTPEGWDPPIQKATSPYPLITAEDFQAMFPGEAGDEAHYREWLVAALRAQATRAARMFTLDSLTEGALLDAAHYIEQLPAPEKKA
jgi:hypothetical protein